MCMRSIMFISKFKYTEDDAMLVTKQAYKLKKSKKEITMMCLVPVFLLIMVGMLIYDINKDKSLVMDIILIILLSVVLIMNIFMPNIIANMQKKDLKNMNLAQYDYTETSFNNGIFKETFYKKGKIAFENSAKIENAFAIYENDAELIVIFNNFSGCIFKKDSLEGGSYEELKVLVLKNIVENKKSPKKKR